MKRTEAPNIHYPNPAGQLIDFPLMRELNQTVMTLATRMMGGGRFATTYGGARDIWQALGYKQEIDFSDYELRYERQDIASRIVDAPCDATWRRPPRVTDDPSHKAESKFEEAWNELVETKRIFHYILRADRISGIGSYGILLIGYEGDSNLTAPVSGSGKEIAYLRPYKSSNAEVDKLEENPGDPRFGLPETYKLKSGSGSAPVHWTRVLHLAEGLGEDDVNGTPRLKKVYNRLENIELIVGGAAEGWWRSGIPGLAIEGDKDAVFEQKDAEDLEKQIRAYIHHLQRWITVQGAKVKPLSTPMGDPGKAFDIAMSLVSAASGIPKRILMGSERGELSSAQDENNWNTRTEERQTNYAEPMILRPFIDRQIEFGKLPTPNGGKYHVLWDDAHALGAKAQSEVTKSDVESITKYAASPGADRVVPPSMFRMKYLRWSKDEVAEAEKELETLEVEAAPTEEEVARMAAEEELQRQAGRVPEGGKVTRTKPAPEGGDK